jgi:hypothetical protein
MTSESLIYFRSLQHWNFLIICSETLSNEKDKLIHISSWTSFWDFYLGFLSPVVCILPCIALLFHHLMSKNFHAPPSALKSNCQLIHVMLVFLINTIGLYSVIASHAFFMKKHEMKIEGIHCYSCTVYWTRFVGCFRFSINYLSTIHSSRQK